MELVRPPARAYTSPNQGELKAASKRLKEDIPMRARLCRARVATGAGGRVHRYTRLMAGVVTMLMLSGTAMAQRDTDAMSAALAGTFILFALGMGLVCYVYMALALQTIATKTGTPDGWLAWVPIGNAFLMLNIAKKPLWWFLLFLIPLVNIAILVVVWMAIAEARQKPNWWGILAIVPVANLIVPGMLAWVD